LNRHDIEALLPTVNAVDSYEIKTHIVAAHLAWSCWFHRMGGYDINPSAQSFYDIFDSYIRIRSDVVSFAELFTKANPIAIRNNLLARVRGSRARVDSSADMQVTVLPWHVNSGF
jgi:hypothetical protein